MARNKPGRVQTDGDPAVPAGGNSAALKRNSAEVLTLEV
jgi:hypothetical protein